MLHVSAELVEAVSNIPSTHEKDFYYDAIIEAMETHCSDAFTRGYLTRKLEMDSESYFYPNEMLDEFLYFLKRIQKLNEEKE